MWRCTSYLAVPPFWKLVRTLMHFAIGHSVVPSPTEGHHTSCPLGVEMALL